MTAPPRDARRLPPDPIAGLPGVSSAGCRDAGAFLQSGFALVPGQERIALEAILVRMREGDEVALADPDAGECWRELRRAAGGWQSKRGCHGAHGTWRDCDADEALAWLLEVAHQNRADPTPAPAAWTRRAASAAP